MNTTPNLPSLAVACPMCGSAAGQPCTSHGGKRVRRDNVHLARKVAWEQSRIDAVPAAKLVADHGAWVRHAKHAAELLDKHGYATEAEQIRRATSERNGLMSAKQAIAFLVDGAEDGEGR
ncbi:hypothetical protein [Streptomyces sp. NBC_00996]|uniref:zinc finger domain-containing protein n=1 Tax=Streptomyces sp. NBC_00996 TaxID=2903710 RepID=UPI00387006EA|nr:hypothetical protein OG390_17305 [Streptomyces sp. NBC_00996]